MEASKALNTDRIDVRAKLAETANEDVKGKNSDAHDLHIRKLN